MRWLTFYPDIACLIDRRAKPNQTPDASSEIFQQSSSSFGHIKSVEKFECQQSILRVQSAIDNVTVTKFEVISPTQVSIDLKYSGAGNTPAVTVDVGAINLRSKLVQDF